MMADLKKENKPAFDYQRNPNCLSYYFFLMHFQNPLLLKNKTFYFTIENHEMIYKKRVFY